MLILQGSDFEREFMLQAGVAVRYPFLNFAGTGTIYIWDSSIFAPSAQILTLGNQTFQLNSNLAVGERSMITTAGTMWTPGFKVDLAEGDEIGVKPIEIGGWTFESQIWVSQEAKLAQLAPLATFTAVTSNPSIGKFKLSLPKSVTTTLKPTCSWEDYQDVKLEDMSRTDFALRKLYGNQAWRTQALAGSSYYWDVESTESFSNKVMRRIEGLVAVARRGRGDG